MNENLNLEKILKNCPQGTKFYSILFGEVVFYKIKKESNYPIICIKTDGNYCETTSDGRYYETYDGECTLFPSAKQRDWGKFKAPWLKKKKFDPKTLKPFDRVLFTNNNNIWDCAIVSYIKNDIIYFLANSGYVYYCIPYNEDTKHLVGTTEEAPEYYRYWED